MEFLLVSCTQRDTPTTTQRTIQSPTSPHILLLLNGASPTMQCNSNCKMQGTLTAALLDSKSTEQGRLSTRRKALNTLPNHTPPITIILTITIFVCNTVISLTRAIISKLTNGSTITPAIRAPQAPASPCAGPPLFSTH